MMHIHILDSQNYLQPFESRVKDSAARAIEVISRHLSPSLDNESFCADTLFKGIQPEVFPKYAGYAVGFGLVGRYLSSEGASAGGCVSMPTREILRHSVGCVGWIEPDAEFAAIEPGRGNRQ